MIGNLWSEYLRATTRHRSQGGDFTSVDALAITPTDVAHLMTILKIARANLGDPKQVDNYIDAAGYQSLAGALSMGDALVVPAVSQEETYKAEIEEKLRRARAAANSMSESRKQLGDAMQAVEGNVDEGK